MLNDRILVAKRTFNKPVTVKPVVPSSRPLKYKSWSESNLHSAYLAHVEEGLSVRRAADAFGVPKSTLQDRVSGRVCFGAKSGPPKFLSDEEELELVNFLCGCAAVGYAKSKQQVLSLVRSVVRTKGIEATVTDGWWSSFKRRHGQLTVRAAEPLSYSRAVASSPQIISRYYDILEQTLLDNDLVDKPTQIYNMDETGMPLDPHPTKIVSIKGTKHPVVVTTGNKAQVTVVSACSASGHVLPPMVIFDRKTLKPELTYGEVPGTMYGLSKNGWIDSELFKLWFTHHFLPNVPPLRPLLLIMDGHSTHYQPSVVRLAAAEKVILFCLPPNTTHLTQPLDKGCFSPLKTAWRQQCQQFLSDNASKVITRYEFSRLFSKAWFVAMTQSNVISGFRCTGIYPFNREAIQLPISVDPGRALSLEKQTGLSFIPLYSCSPSSRRSSRISHGHENLATSNSDDDSENFCQQQDMSPRLYRQSSVTRTITRLDLMPPKIQVPVAKEKSCGRVLTSSENLRQIEQREKEKKEKELSRKKRQKKVGKKSTEVRETLTPLQVPTRSSDYVQDKEVVFSDHEWNHFQTRYDEGYDLPPTGRYKLWLEIYHPIEELELNESDHENGQSDSIIGDEQESNDESDQEIGRSDSLISGASRSCSNMRGTAGVSSRSVTRGTVGVSSRSNMRGTAGVSSHSNTRGTVGVSSRSNMRGTAGVSSRSNKRGTTTGASSVLKSRGTNVSAEQELNNEDSVSSCSNLRGAAGVRSRSNTRGTAGVSSHCVTRGTTGANSVQKSREASVSAEQESNDEESVSSSSKTRGTAGVSSRSITRGTTTLTSTRSVQKSRGAKMSAGAGQESNDEENVSPSSKMRGTAGVSSHSNTRGTAGVSSRSVTRGTVGVSSRSNTRGTAGVSSHSNTRGTTTGASSVLKSRGTNVSAEQESNNEDSVSSCSNLRGTAGVRSRSNTRATAGVSSHCVTRGTAGANSVQKSREANVSAEQESNDEESVSSSSKTRGTAGVSSRSITRGTATSTRSVQKSRGAKISAGAGQESNDEENVSPSSKTRGTAGVSCRSNTRGTAGVSSRSVTRGTAGVSSRSNTRGTAGVSSRSNTRGTTTGASSVLKSRGANVSAEQESNDEDSVSSSSKTRGTAGVSSRTNTRGTAGVSSRTNTRGIVGVSSRSNTRGTAGVSSRSNTRRTTGASNVLKCRGTNVSAGAGQESNDEESVSPSSNMRGTAGVSSRSKTRGTTTGASSVQKSRGAKTSAEQESNDESDHEIGQRDSDAPRSRSIARQMAGASSRGSTRGTAGRSSCGTTRGTDGARSTIPHRSTRAARVSADKRKKTDIQGTLCVKRMCTNHESITWLSCDKCSRWYHCDCVGISYENAQKHSFVCCSDAK